MSRLKLPNLLDPELTIERWGAELRATNFITDNDFTPIKWTPEVSTGSLMTIGPFEDRQGIYIKVGPLIFFWTFCRFTLGGVASNLITFTLPVGAAPDLLTIPTFIASTVIADGAGGQAGTTILTGDHGDVRRYDAGNWGLGAAKDFRVTGVYFAAP